MLWLLLQKILIYLPDLIHKRWQMHSIGEHSFSIHLFLNLWLLHTVKADFGAIFAFSAMILLVGHQEEIIVVIFVWLIQWWTLPFLHACSRLVDSVLNDRLLEEHLACKNWVMRCWRGYLSGVRCTWCAYGSADAAANPSFLALLKGRLV